jgi:hypothetical protein
MLYHFDPMTATRPLEDDQPLGAVSSHRVIFYRNAFLHSTLIASYRPVRLACDDSGIQEPQQVVIHGAVNPSMLYKGQDTA